METATETRSTTNYVDFREYLVLRWPDIAPDYILVRMHQIDWDSDQLTELITEAMNIVQNNFGSDTAEQNANLPDPITVEMVRAMLAARWPDIQPGMIITRLARLTDSLDDIMHNAVMIVASQYGGDVANSDARPSPAPTPPPTVPVVVSPEVVQPSKPESLNCIKYEYRDSWKPVWTNRLPKHASAWTYLGSYQSQWDMYYTDGGYGPDLRVVGNAQQNASIPQAKELLQRSSYDCDSQPALACAYLVAYERGLKGCEWKPMVRLFTAYIGTPTVTVASLPLPFVEPTEAEISQMTKLIDLMPMTGSFGHAQGTFMISKLNKMVTLQLRSKWYKREETWKLVCLWNKMGYKFQDNTLKANGGSF